MVINVLVLLFNCVMVYVVVMHDYMVYVVVVVLMMNNYMVCDDVVLVMSACVYVV